MRLLVFFLNFLKNHEKKITIKLPFDNNFYFKHIFLSDTESGGKAMVAISITDIPIARVIDN